MNVNSIDAGVSVLMVWLLLPRMGLWGYILAIYVTETLNTSLSLCRMLRMSEMPVSLWRLVFGPLLCILGATAICRLAGAAVGGTIGCTRELAVHIALCGGLYLTLLVATGMVRRQKPRA
jgi:O-antigen/teichoic acid export membrane protein